MALLDVLLFSLALCLVQLPSQVVAQLTRPAHLSIVVWNQYPEDYDITTDPWLLNSGLVGTISVPTDGTCMSGPLGTSFAISALHYQNFAEYDELDGVIQPPVFVTSSRAIWTPDITYNCAKSLVEPCGFLGGTSYIFTNMGSSAAEVGFCEIDVMVPMAFAVLSRECTLLRYQSSSFIDSGGFQPLIIDYEFLPLITMLDYYATRSKIQMGVVSSIRTPGQKLNKVSKEKKNRPTNLDSHIIGHALDINYHCTTCSRTGGPSSCDKYNCMRDIGKANSVDATTYPAAFWLFTKGGSGYSNIGSKAKPGPLRWGGSFSTPDWNHLDDNAYFNTLGTVLTQDETWLYTMWRVQAELTLVCAGVSCVDNPGAPYDPVGRDDVLDAICTAKSGVTSKLQGTYPMSNSRRLLQIPTTPANLSTASILAVINLLKTTISDLYSQSQPPYPVLRPYSLGSNYSSYATWPTYDTTSVWQNISMESIEVFDSSASASNQLTLELPQAWADLLDLLNNATTGAVNFSTFTSAVSDLALPTSALTSNVTYNQQLTKWAGRMLAYNISSLTGNDTLFNADGGLPLQMITLNGSIVSFEYIISGSVQTVTVTGNLSVNTTTTVSTYAFLTGCYHVLRLNATRVVVTTGSGSSRTTQLRLNTAVPNTYSYAPQPDNCLYLQPGAGPISTGGWLVSWSDTVTGVTGTMGVIVDVNGSSLVETGGEGQVYQTVMGASMMVGDVQVFASGTLTPALPVLPWTPIANDARSQLAPAGMVGVSLVIALLTTTLRL